MRFLYVAVSLLVTFHASTAAEYFGKYLGPLKGNNHGVSGDVYAVDARTFYIKDFSYDGEGPAAYFYVGSTKTVNGNGHRLTDEKGSANALPAYRKKSITLSFPEGKTLNNIKWFSVWCDEAAVSFADIKIPKNLDFPKPQKISPLAGIHAVSSEPIVVVDAQTLLIPSFSYDGEAPDAKFWAGRGDKPSPQGVRIPDENGKEIPLRKYDRKTIVLTLPGDLTIFDIGHFGVWCEAFTVDFGHIRVPRGLNVPPSLKMLGVSPQSKLNCEVLHEQLALEVRWALAGDSIVVQLVAKLEDGEYISFGLSGDNRHNKMIGGDVVVAWVDHETLSGYVVDYFLEGKSQCAGTRGSCPDYRFQENADSVRLLNAALVNGYSIVTYQRPIKARDVLDKPILTNTSQAIIWAVGPLNSKQETSFHSIFSKRDTLLEFGRTPKWNCPIPESDAALAASNEGLTNEEVSLPHQETASGSLSPISGSYKTPPPPAAATNANEAWKIPPIECNEPEDGVLYAQMGPTGGKHGYSAITKHVGWGIAYYINGLLIPEINVVRGKTYTFVTEGGNDAEYPAKFHPFYITDDPIGGYEHKSPQEKQNVRIFAGVDFDEKDNAIPTGTGRFCGWTPDPEQPPSDDFVSFGAYQRTLTLICDHGEPGFIQWTPDKDTPDTVYYQCFSHRYLGWKINVLDECNLPTKSTTGKVNRDRSSHVDHDDELESHPSDQVSVRVNPQANRKSINQGYISQDTISSYKLISPVISKNVDASFYPKAFMDYKQTNLNLNSDQINVTQNTFSFVDKTKTLLPESESVEERISKKIVYDSTTPLFQHVYNISKDSVDSRLRNTDIKKPKVSNNNALKIRLNSPVTSVVNRTAGQQNTMRKNAFSPSKTLNQSGKLRRTIVVKKPGYRIPSNGMVTPERRTYPSKRADSMPVKKSHIQPNVRESVSVSFSSSKVKPSVPQIKVNENKKPVTFLRNRPSIAMSNMSNLNSDSLITEGGFKPLNRNTMLKRVFKLGDNADSNANGNEEKDRTFEPIYIPSSIERSNDSSRKSPELNFKTNHQKKKTYRWKPTDQKVNQDEADELDETAMAAERMETYYLPPFSPAYQSGSSKNRQDAEPVDEDGDSRMIVTYDGKPVIGSHLIPPVSDLQSFESPKHKGSSADLIRNTPQFGPFRGEIPPPVPSNVRSDSIPQLKLSSDDLPPHSLSLHLRPNPKSLQQGRTRLSQI